MALAGREILAESNTVQDQARDYQDRDLGSSRERGLLSTLSISTGKPTDLRALSVAHLHRIIVEPAGPAPGNLLQRQAARQSSILVDLRR